MMKNKKKNVETELGKKETLQAIVLADDFTENLTPVQNVFPCVLMPVVNAPLLDYLIETLVKSGVHELFLYCSTHIDTMKEYVRRKNISDISVSLLCNEGCRSLGDALRDIDAKGLIRYNFILIRGDAFINADLKRLLASHANKAKHDKGIAMTMMLRDLGSTNTRALEGESSIVVSDASNRKVLFYKKLEKENKKLKLELEWFLGHDRIQINSSFLDTHTYLCSPSVLPLFSDNFDFQTMEDFIRGVLMNEEILDSRIYWEELDCDEYALPITSWRMYQMLSREILQGYSYPLTPDTVPFLKNFVFMSRCTYKHRSATLTKGCTLQRDSIVGSNSTIGENTFISRSVIGDRCTLGSNVRIENSYVLSNVVINDGCVVKNCIIFSDCTLENRAEIDGCVLSPAVHLKAESSCEDSFLQPGSNAVATKMSENDFSADSEFLYFKYNEDKDCDSYSENDESTCDRSTGPESPLPDDTNMFLLEVIDSLLRGYQDKLKCENLILEINSSRYAYNVSLREVTYNVIKAIMSLPMHQLSETKTALNNANYQKTLKSMISYFRTIVLNYVKTEDAQEDCLRAIEDVASTTPELLTFVKNLLHLFYEQDILSEEKIMEWYEQSDDEGDEVRSREVRTAVQPFIKWLQEAEEDSSDSEGD